MGNSSDTAQSDWAAGRNPETDPIIRSLTEDDAEALSRCVTSCYGDSYPGREFYDPKKIRSFLSQGLMHSQIAVTREGEVVGHLGIMLEHIGDITADAIAGFVAPDYRGSNTMFRLGLNLNIVNQELHLIGLQMYALMLHTITQKKALAVGGVETGLLTAYFPASTKPKGFERSDDKSRIPAMLMYVPLRPAPERTVFIPERYADIISHLYKQLKYIRLMKEAENSRSTKPASVTIVKKPGLGIAQVKVHQPGYDLPDITMRLQQQFRLEDVGAMYVDLPLWDPASATLVEDLRSLGLFYGGVVIERGGGDLLRLQGLLNAHIAPDADIIVSQSGRELLDFVMGDARDVGAV
jgi:serine/threonine-protein kinase RsbW